MPGSGFKRRRAGALPRSNSLPLSSLPCSHSHCCHRLRRPAAPQRRQGRHDAQAGRRRRADPGPGREPVPGHEADQETVKVRTYTVPAGSRIEQSQTARCRSQPNPPSALLSRPINPQLINSQPSPAFILSAPMPVVEREETRARTELGAAQKDTARELGAKLSSLKGIVWVGRRPVRVRPGVAGVAAAQGGHRQRDDQRGADARRRGPHGPAQPGGRQ